MANTQIADVIVPAVFVPYMVKRTMELSAFFQSGVAAQSSALLPAVLMKGGDTINMPFWNEANDDDDVLSDSSPLTPSAITSGKDLAVIHFRGKAWSANDLAHQLAGDDPLSAIADHVSEYWARKMQKVMIASLNGAFSSASMSGNVLDVSAATDPTLNGKSILDAAQLLGDAKAQIAAIAMHSATETSLAKLDLIDAVRDSNGTFMFNAFMGRRVIIDDGLPVSGDTYTSYLFGAGAIGYSEGGVLKPVEFDRDILAGDDMIATRRAYIMHPLGVSWQGSATGASPTNTELAVGTNWNRVYESKSIRIIQVKHKLAAAA